MSPYTVEHYSRFINRFSREFGPAILSSIETSDLVRLLDHWSETDNAWNNALRAIKHLFSYAVNQYRLTPNPCAPLEKRKIVTEGFEPWSVEDTQKFLSHHKCGSKAHLAMMLLLEVAPRRSDLVTLGP